MNSNIWIMRAAVLLGLAQGYCFAAHLYAAAPAGINVYSVADNGSLTFVHTVPSGPVTALATTPGGRFLYATDGLWITEYALQPDGRLLASGAPVAVPGHEATGDLAVHPTTGDYLYTVATTMNAFRTDDTDGHLTFSSAENVATDGYRLAASPSGEFVVALAGERGLAVPMKTNLDGTLAGHGTSFNLPGLATGAIAADSRFVYVGTVPFDNEDPARAQLLVLTMQPDGSLAQATAQNVHATKLLAIRDRFVAVSAGGLGSKLAIYDVSPSGALQQTDEKPIEVFAVSKGTKRWAGNLFVATDDGIVTYSLGSDGKLTRIGKAMVNSATRIAFGAL